MTTTNANLSGTETDIASCPRCHHKGKTVKPITLHSLLTEDSQSRVTDLDGFRFCATIGCEVAYYRSSDDVLFKVSDVRVPIGQKQTDPSRTLCYCFNHKASEIESDVVAKGTSSVLDEIVAKCNQGLDRCPQTNPQGSCCLGNVKVAVIEAKARYGGGSAADQSAATAPVVDVHDCCDQSTIAAASPNRSGRGGAITAGGAILAAVLSSACCWLPLLLLAFGASAAGVAGFFERYRPVLLGATAVLLACAFYFAYRKPACAPGEPCAMPNPGLRRFNKVAIWAVTVMVIAFAAFPQYIGALRGQGPNRASQAGAMAFPDRVFRIEGMTCAGCASNLESDLARVPGVARVEVSYEDESAKVYFERQVDLRPSDAQLMSVIASAGFKGIPKVSIRR